MSLKGAPLFPPLFCKTKGCMHNKCMGLYGNLAQTSASLVHAALKQHVINNTYASF